MDWNGVGGGRAFDGPLVELFVDDEVGVSENGVGWGAGGRCAEREPKRRSLVMRYVLKRARRAKV